jgi:hypothetical protein
VLAGSSQSSTQADAPAETHTSADSLPEPAAVPRGHAREDMLADDVVRTRTAPDRFSESEYSQWSAYDLSRIGARHDRVHEDVAEACAAEPALAAELGKLFSGLRTAASAAAGTDPTSEFVGEMERVAATTLHSALLECLQASGVMEEHCHIWADEPAAALLDIPAYLPDPSGISRPASGRLQILPPHLIWTAVPVQEDAAGSIAVEDAEAEEEEEIPATLDDDGNVITPACVVLPARDSVGGGGEATSAPREGQHSEAATCESCEWWPQEASWELASFSGVNEDADEHAECQLRLLQGEDDGLLFGFQNETDLVRFE